MSPPVASDLFIRDLNLHLDLSYFVIISFVKSHIQINLSLIECWGGTLALIVMICSFRQHFTLISLGFAAEKKERKNKFMAAKKKKKDFPNLLSQQAGSKSS